MSERTQQAASYRAGSVAGLLTTLALSGAAAAAPQNLPGQFSPWPPSKPGAYEVRLLLQGAPAPLASAAVDAAGRFTLPLPQTLPATTLVDLLDAFGLKQGCDFKASAKLPDVRAAIARLELHDAISNEHRGPADRQQRDEQTARFLAPVYVSAAATLRGNGTCGPDQRVNINADLEPGWNFLRVDVGRDDSMRIHSIRAADRPARYALRHEVR